MRQGSETARTPYLLADKDDKDDGSELVSFAGACVMESETREITTSGREPPSRKTCVLTSEHRSGTDEWARECSRSGILNCYRMTWACWPNKVFNPFPTPHQPSRHLALFSGVGRSTEGPVGRVTLAPNGVRYLFHIPANHHRYRITTSVPKC